MKLLKVVHESWFPFFSVIEQKGILDEIKKLDPNSFYPASGSVFNVFTMPINNIRVVILGQDPYPNEGQAIGYAFAISEFTKKPFSLKIIEKEIGHSVENTLLHWREQGVFLLNTALTVQKRNAGSHVKLWKSFTLNVIDYITTKRSCVWLLWGRNAQEFEGNIILNIPQHILKASHPAAEVYGKKFIGCKHFEKTNEILIKQGEKPINW